MTFQKVQFNTTKKINGEDDFVGKITGRSNAIFLRNKYQMELDNAHAAIVNMIHYVEDKTSSLKGSFNNSQRLKQDINVKMEKRKSLYDKLDSMLSSEKGHEKEMWFETMRARVEEFKGKNITIYQKNRNTDIDQNGIGGSSKYPNKYPDSKLQPRFADLIRDIDNIENEVSHKRQEYNNAVSEYNYLLSLFEKDVKKCDDKLDVYESILEDGNNKINSCGYHSTFFYRVSSEKSKAETNLDTLQHRFKQFKNTLDIIKKDLSQYEGKKFTEMEY